MRIDPVLARRIGLPALGFFAILSILSAVLAGGDWSAWLQDLSLNLAVTALGIPITVLLIDELVKCHDIAKEKQEWAGVTQAAKIRVSALAHGVIQAFRGVLGIGDLFIINVEDLEDASETIFDKVLNQTLFGVEERLIPALDGIGQLPYENVVALANQLSKLADDGERTAQLFQARLDQSTSTELLQLQQGLALAAQLLPMYSSFRAAAESGRMAGNADAATLIESSSELMAGLSKNCVVRAASLFREMPFTARQGQGEAKAPSPTGESAGALEGK